MSKRRNNKAAETSNVEVNNIPETPETETQENIQIQSELQQTELVESLTQFDKLKEKFNSEQVNSEVLLTASFVTRKTVFEPVYSLIRSTANKYYPLPKELKGTARNIQAKERNRKVLQNLIDGQFLDGDSVLKRFRENLQAVLPFSFGLILDLTNVETSNIIKFACKRVKTDLEYAFTAKDKIKDFKQTYEAVKKAQNASA